MSRPEDDVRSRSTPSPVEAEPRRQLNVPVEIASASRTAEPVIRMPVPVRRPAEEPPREEPSREEPAREPWQDELQRFVNQWRRENPPSAEERQTPMARTHLSVTRTAETGDALQGKGAKQVPVIVSNQGNVAAYTCVIRAMEARPREPMSEFIPLSEFTLGGQIVLTLQPGETRTVEVPFTRTRDTGTFIALVSDPVLDPNELTVADWTHRRILLANL